MPTEQRSDNSSETPRRIEAAMSVAGTEQSDRSGDVEERFVERQRLDDRGVPIEEVLCVDTTASTPSTLR